LGFAAVLLPGLLGLATLRHRLGVCYMNAYLYGTSYIHDICSS
jgi:hypothetical protein